MPIASDWNINYITKQINHVQWVDEITGSNSSVAEQRSITTAAASSFNTTGTASHFLLWSATDATAYYVWYNLTDTGTETDPGYADKTGIKVDVLSTNSANQVAAATVTAINTLAGTDFTAAGSTSPFTLNNDISGSCTAATNPSSNGSGFSFTITTTGIGRTVWSVNSLYSYLQDTFDELNQMDDKIPMSAQTPTEYSLINGWFIDEVSIKYLKGGAIQTIGWTGGQVVQQRLNGNSPAYTNVVSSDLGKTVTETDTGDTGTLLFADNTRRRWWIRPDVPGTGGDEFDDPSSAYTISPTGTGTGSSTAPSLTGENTWANMFTIGTIESNTAIYVVQDNQKTTSWWPVGHIDVLIRVREAGSNTGPNAGLLTTIFIGAREYSKLYDHFVSVNITGGRNPVPLATGIDLNNNTGQYQTIVTTAAGSVAVGETFTANANPNKEGTITSVTGTAPNLTIRYYLSGTSLIQFANNDACTTSGSGTFTVVTPSDVVSGYGGGGSAITLTFSDITRDLNNGNGPRHYDVEINCGGRPVVQMYEWLKFITRRGYSNTPQQLRTGTGSHPGTANTNINGEQYISLLSGFTPIKASPFGTFAGGKFFGAQGVWITNYDSADNKNFQLIDSQGVTQVPPNTVAVTVSAVVASDVVGVFVLDQIGGIVRKNTYTMTTQSSGLGTIIVSGAINPETPQSGIVRIVDDSDPLKAEQQYEYASWSASTFILKSYGSGGSPRTATGGNISTLTDSTANFYTARIRPGDSVTNVTQVETVLVVSVDSATQLTTVSLSTGSWSGDTYYIETLTNRSYTTSDTAYVPIVNERILIGQTSVSNTLIKTPSAQGGQNIPVLVRVRQGKVILPFEIENAIGDTGMNQAAIRTPDTIAT